MSHLKAISFVVHHIEKTARFFREVLECNEVETVDEEGEEYENLYQIPQVRAKRITLKLGNEKIDLVQFNSHKGSEFPKNSSSTDLWFQHIAIVVSDMEKAYEKLMRNNVVSISHAPQTIPEWNVPAAGVQAFYFFSPERHPLELIHFPDDKGREEWHDKKSLFLGIDHTAIAISDTDRSLEFYQKTLELEVLGKSLNYGETQEKLTAISDARVKITGLQDKARKGIGLEFLHYIQGKKGRPAVHAIHDLSATKQIVECQNLDEILRHVPADAILGRGLKHAMITDPDGHHILLCKERN